MSRRTLAAAAVIAAAAAAFLALRRAPAPPDEDAIRALFDDAARAASERRVSDAVALVSDAFRGEGLDKRGVKQLVAFQVLRGEWVSVAVAGSRVLVEGDAARATVDAVLARGGAEGKSLAALVPEEASAHRFTCALAREADGWRVVSAEWRAISLGDALAGPPDPAAPAR
jgi:hypothetical protein